MLNWLVYATLGKVIISLWLAFHLPEWLTKFKFVEKLHECDLCSGVWIYAILALFWKIDVINVWFGLPSVFILGEIITGMLTSYLVHIFSIGFRTKYLEVIVE